MGRPRVHHAHTVLAAVAGFVRERGYGPTIEDIRTQSGIPSPRTILRLLAELERDRLIVRWPGSRGIGLVEDWCPTCGRIVHGSAEYRNARTKAVLHG